MAVSKAQIKATAKYEAKTYDKTLIRLPKGRLDEIRAHIEPAGESLNGFIGRAINEAMERDGAGSSQEAAGAPAGGGAIYFSSDTLEAAQRAADAAGEFVGDFIRRAVAAQAKRDTLEGPTLMDAAIEAAEATGETPADFIARAIETQAKRDKSSIALGINPTTGDKLKGEA